RRGKAVDAAFRARAAAGSRSVSPWMGRDWRGPVFLQCQQQPRLAHEFRRHQRAAAKLRIIRLGRRRRIGGGGGGGGGRGWGWRWGRRRWRRLVSRAAYKNEYGSTSSWTRTLEGSFTRLIQALRNAERSTLRSARTRKRRRCSPRITESGAGAGPQRST